MSKIWYASSSKEGDDMAIYRAPEPLVSDYQKKIFILKLIIPLTALWLGLKYVVNAIFGRLLGNVVLRPQSAEQLKDDLIDDITTYNSETLSCHAEKVITHDHCELDTIEINHQAQNDRPPHEKEYIIYFNGRWGCYEKSIDKIIYMANDLQANVVTFNYRSVGKSTGKAYSKKDLYTDGIAQVQRLLDQGVNPELIVLRGYSLGGAIATKVTKYFHSQGIKINVFNERSLSNVIHVIAGFLRHIGSPHKSGHKSGTLGIILSYVLWPFVKLGLLLNDWEIEAADTFKELPARNKEYSAVRSSKKQLQEDDKIIDDSGVTHYASMHRALKGERRKEKNEIKNAREHIHQLVTSNPLVTRALRKADEQFDEALNYLKSRKMVAKPEMKYENAHYLDLKDLTSRATNQSGATFFKNFVKNTQELHYKKVQEEMLDAGIVGQALR
jgi:hypothetical protein